MIEPLNLNFERIVTNNEINGVSNGVSNNVMVNNSRKTSGHPKYNYLNYLLKFQCLFGITYFGNTFVDLNRKLSLFIKTCLVCYDLLLVVLFMVFQYFAFTDDSYNRTFSSNESNKMIMNIIFTLSTFAMAIEFNVIKFVTLFRGKTIITNLMSFGKFGKKIPIIS